MKEKLTRDFSVMIPRLGSNHPTIHQALEAKSYCLINQKQPLTTLKYFPSLDCSASWKYSVSVSRITDCSSDHSFLSKYTDLG